MSFLAGSETDPNNFVAVAVGALSGASLRFLLTAEPVRLPAPRSWIVESVLASGVVLGAGSAPFLSPLGLGGLAALAAYPGTAFAVTWMGQIEAEHAPVVPAAHLLVTLFASLAGPATVMAMAGQF
jgi:hypothetical protein